MENNKILKYSLYSTFVGLELLPMTFYTRSKFGKLKYDKAAHVDNEETGLTLVWGQFTITLSVIPILPILHHRSANLADYSPSDLWSMIHWRYSDVVPSNNARRTE